MNKKLLTGLAYFGIFVILTGFYNFIWIMVIVHIDGSYIWGENSKYFALSLGMSSISTIGFYLKARLAHKKKETISIKIFS
jgi:hypothetical protein